MEANTLMMFEDKPHEIPDNMFFKVSYMAGGNMLSKNLIEEGDRIELTSQNLELYKELHPGSASRVRIPGTASFRYFLVLSGI